MAALDALLCPPWGFTFWKHMLRFCSDYLPTSCVLSGFLWSHAALPCCLAYVSVRLLTFSSPLWFIFPNTHWQVPNTFLKKFLRRFLESWVSNCSFIFHQLCDLGESAKVPWVSPFKDEKDGSTARVKRDSKQTWRESIPVLGTRSQLTLDISHFLFFCMSS